jgi:hypothetical protein
MTIRSIIEELASNDKTQGPNRLDMYKSNRNRQAYNDGYSDAIYKAVILLQGYTIADNGKDISPVDLKFGYNTSESTLTYSEYLESIINQQKYAIHSMAKEMGEIVGKLNAANE